MNGFPGNGCPFVDGTNGLGYTFQLSPTPVISSWDQGAEDLGMATDSNFQDVYMYPQQWGQAVNRQPWGQAMNPQQWASILAREKLNMRHGCLQGGQSTYSAPEASTGLTVPNPPIQVVGRGRGHVSIDQSQPNMTPETLLQIAEELKRAKRAALNNRPSHSSISGEPATSGQCAMKSEAISQPTLVKLPQAGDGGQGSGTVGVSRVKLNPLAPPFGASNLTPNLTTGIGKVNILQRDRPTRMVDPSNPMVEANATLEVFLEMGKRFALMTVNQKKQLLVEVRKKLGSRFNDASIDTVVNMMTELNLRKRDLTK